MKLPNINDGGDARDASAIQEALHAALKPFYEEIRETIVSTRKMAKGVDGREFNVNAMKFIVERLAEAIREMAEKDGGKIGDTSDERAFTATKGFAAKNAREQNVLLKEILKNAKFQTELTKMLTNEVGTKLYRDMEKLIDVIVLGDKDRKRAEAESKRFLEERERREARERAEKRSGRRTDGAYKPRGSAKKFRTYGGLAASLRRMMEDLGVLVGMGGLVSMLPKEFKDFVSKYVVAITELKAVLQTGMLKPVLQILDHIPILGAIVRKLPYLSALLAAFDVLPKVFEKYKTDGWWPALETGLQGLYKFFVGDIAVLAGNLMDWMKDKLFGDTLFSKLNYTAYAEAFNVGVSNVITDLVAVVKRVWEDGFDLNKMLHDADLERVTEDLLWDALDAVVASVRALFNYGPEDEFSAREYLNDTYREWEARAKAWWDGLNAAWDSFTTRVRESTFEWLVKKPMEGVMALNVAVSNAIAAAFTRVKDAAEASFEFPVIAAEWAARAVEDFSRKMFDSAVELIDSAVDAVIAKGIDITGEVTDWFKDMWTVVKNWIYENTVGMLPGMGSGDSQPTLRELKRSRMDAQGDAVFRGTASQRDDRQPTRTVAPAIIQKNSSASSVTNFTVIGKPKASYTGPLYRSVGGGGGF